MVWTYYGTVTDYALDNVYLEISMVYVVNHGSFSFGGSTCAMSTRPPLPGCC